MITRNCPDTAVYWGAPVEDGMGGKTFDSQYPIEIACRWEEMTQIVADAKGVESNSRAVVYVLQDLDEEGYLYKGTLDSLYDLSESSAGALTDPTDFENTFVIKRFQKTPALKSTTQFLRKAYLTPSLSFGGF